MRSEWCPTAATIVATALVLASCRGPSRTPPPASYVVETAELADSALSSGAAEGVAAPVRGAAVTPAFFGAGTDSVRPLLGRFFVREEYQPSPPRVGRVLVLTHAFWQRRYHAQPQVVGRTVRLGRQPAVVVGVTAPDFEVPPGVDIVWPRAAGGAPRPQAP